MYFIAAEAMLQTNKQEAVDLMNEFLMKRAIPGKENDMKITESELTIDFILDERARELCGEQIRWFDLKRTKKLVEYVKLHNMDAKDNIQEYHMLRPIPQNQLDAVTNKDEFTQNPGYKKNIRFNGLCTIACNIYESTEGMSQFIRNSMEYHS